MEHTHYHAPLEIKALAEAGTFEGYGTIFGCIDRDGDVMEKGAFLDSLKARLPALLWQHNAREPIGRFDEIREDERGLFVKGRLSLEGRGKEAYELLKMGALNGLSVGFITKEATKDAANAARRIRKADLMEVSLVTFPANEEARIATVKSMKTNNAGSSDPRQNIRAFEQFLHSNGFGRKHAMRIASTGFSACANDIEVQDFVRNIMHRKHKLSAIL